MTAQQTIIDQLTELCQRQQAQIRLYQSELVLIENEAETELARIEREGGCAGFAQRIWSLSLRRP